MNRIKHCIHAGYLISLIAWIVSFIFLRGTVFPLALAINLVIESLWEVVLIFFKPRYDGHLIFKLKEGEEGKEIYRFELYDAPEDWPNKKELIIRVGTKEQNDG